jgi:hypothetical protein
MKKSPLFVLTLILSLGAPVASAEVPQLEPGEVQEGEPIEQVDMEGVVQTGVKAAGGEATGYQFTRDNKKTYELRIRERNRKAVEEMNGKRVRLKGFLTVRSEAERKNVLTIIVTSIELADKAPATAPGTQPSTRPAK